MKSRNRYIQTVHRIAFREDTQFMRQLACMEYPYLKRILDDEQEATETDVRWVEIALEDQLKFIRFYCSDSPG